MFEIASYEPFILMCREEKTSTSQLIVGLYNVKIMFYRYLYRILLVELLSEKSCKTFFFLNILFAFINLFFMIVKFCTYQFIEPNKFLNVGSREKSFL